MPQGRGIKDLVSAIVGGSQTQQNARFDESSRLVKARSDAALMNRRIADAVRATQETEAFSGLDSVITDPVELALIKSGVGSDFAAVQRGNNSIQERDFRREAVLQALSGDPNAANANLVGVASGPIKIADEQGGVILNPFVAGGGEPSVTPVGQSRIDANRSLEAQRRAMAALSDVKAANVHPKTGQSIKPFTSPASSKLVASLVKAGPDGKTVNRIEEFQRWQFQQAQIDPIYNNGDFALAAFLSPSVSGDADVLRRAAQRAIAAGADPAQVNKTLEEQIQRISAPGGQ